MGSGLPVGLQWGQGSLWGCNGVRAPYGLPIGSLWGQGVPMGSGLPMGSQWGQKVSMGSPWGALWGLTGQQQVPEAVPRGGGHDEAPPPHALHVADAAPGAGGGATEWSHGWGGGG